MSFEIAEEAPPNLADYSTVPIAFEVHEVLDDATLLENRSASAVRTRSVAPFVKDYDAIPDNGPLSWQTRFDLTHWGFFVARSAGTRVGGVAIAFQARELDLLAGQADVALLWDIRVAPVARQSGVGSALLLAAEAWAVGRGVRWLRVETQSINVPAYRFYARHGFVLTHVVPDAYAGHPDEIQLLLTKSLVSPAV